MSHAQRPAPRSRLARRAEEAALLAAAIALALPLILPFA
ncbi:hypothetical protein MPOCJGCO_2545 [Methylobacterium trifolii]|uniref:ABC transporter permease n=1 Tax=Methylobacterium trifolii TaxID=1003092 RepID=A0ABQ4TYX5_9HYPH|nr:hypothetical protein MPOCJGCO_2545 [Methylobacterium trifolii]